MRNTWIYLGGGNGPCCAAGRGVTPLCLLLLLCCLVAPSDVWGRAGGGGSYSSGSGYSSGGSGSDAGAIVELVVILIRLCIEVPVVGIPVTIGFIAWCIIHYSKRKNTAPSTGTGHSKTGRGRVGALQHLHWIEKIRELDPAFDPTVFRKDFEHAFVAIQQAWQNQEMTPVRHFVTDGIYEKFAVQLRTQQLQNYREKLEQISVDKVRIAEWRCEGMFEVLTIEVVASMIDSRVSLDTGRGISGSASANSFVEYWSFIRQRHLLSSDRQGSLLSGTCPNCGSVVELNQFSHCAACDAILRSGTYDWVLSEITQASEWRSHRPQPSLQAAHYRKQHDPEFSLQHIEDRAAVIFYRKVAAEIAGTIAPLRKMATMSYCDAQRLNLSAVDRRIDIDCAVGSVECLGLLTESDQHFAVVEIRWASRMVDAGPDGNIATPGQRRLSYSLMILMRRAAVRSNKETGFASTHCAACGAPETDLTSDACEYCGEVMNTGLHDWVLVDFHRSRSADKAAQWLGRLQKAVQSESATPPTAPDETVARVLAVGDEAQSTCPTECLLWVIRELADHAALSAPQRDVIRQLAKKNGISAELVQQWINNALQDQLPAAQPVDKASRQHWLNEVVDVALADHRVDHAERQLLQQLTTSLGMDPYDINLVIRKKQLRLTGSMAGTSL